MELIGCKTFSNNRIEQYNFIGKDEGLDHILQSDINVMFQMISENSPEINLELFNFLVLGFNFYNNPDFLLNELGENFYGKILNNNELLLKFYNKYFDEFDQLDCQIFLEMPIYHAAEWGPNQSWCLTADGFAILFEETSEEDYFPEQSIYIKAEFYEEFKKDCLDIYKALS